jgi:hypothetical protein
VKYAIPCANIMPDSVNRSSSKPTPRRPAGNVVKNLCRSRSPSQTFRLQTQTPNVTLTDLRPNGITRRWHPAITHSANDWTTRHTPKSM